MKRIGIITIQKCDNYGADLQAYALQAKLRLMGYDAENIDYLFYKHPRHQCGKMEKPVLPISCKNRIKEYLFPIVAYLKSFENRQARIERRRLFDEWFKKNVKTGPEYRSVDSLYVNPPQYDFYMVGSDQVWNPRLYSNIKPYFFDFIPKEARCASYASSFGVDKLSGSVFYKYKQWLKRFSFIGLREKSGERIVNAMALNAEVAHVLDPTLLLSAEKWRKVSVKPKSTPSGKYLLLYDLIPSPETNALAKRWAKEKGWNVERIGDGAYGPGEFIWLFANAEAVVTNSFHGTAFSVINQKPFYSVIARRMSNGGRIESLLAVIGLRNRLITAADCANIEFSDDIDYTSANTRLDNQKAKSEEFLLGMLNGLSENQEKDAKTTFSSRDFFHKPLSSYAVWHGNPTIRAASTSGGAFSVLAEDVLSRGGVVFGAAWDNGFKSVSHHVAEISEDLVALRQSKYVQSDASEAIKKAKAALAAERQVLFCGTPCQCASMRSAAKGLDEEQLILVDFVCHGTPRPEVWQAYADELECKARSQLIRYEFRNKDRGWNFQNIVYAFANGKTKRVIPWLDPYFHGFSINAFLRPSCYSCPFAQLKRIGDFTIGDCWRIAASNPEFDDNGGTSLVLVNTEKATAMWNHILASGRIVGGSCDLDLAQSRNMALMHPPAKPQCYGFFQQTFEETTFFSKSAKCYLSPAKTVKYFLMYWIKRLGWFYFRHHQ